MKLSVLVSAVVAVTATLTSCGTGTVGGSSAACAAVVSWHSHLYWGINRRVLPSHLRPLAMADIPACRDTNHSSGEHAIPVRLARIDGIRPAAAVAVLPRGTVFVRHRTDLSAVLRSPWIRAGQSRPGHRGSA
ncbi:MAG TPA: DUF6281 family protein [Streptosporangiaceae bacterium]